MCMCLEIHVYSNIMKNIKICVHMGSQIPKPKFDFVN